MRTQGMEPETEMEMAQEVETTTAPEGRLAPVVPVAVDRARLHQVVEGKTMALENHRKVPRKRLVLRLPLQEEHLHRQIRLVTVVEEEATRTKTKKKTRTRTPQASSQNLPRSCRTKQRTKRAT